MLCTGLSASAELLVGLNNNSHLVAMFEDNLFTFADKLQQQQQNDVDNKCQ